MEKIKQKELKSRYNKKLKRLGFECECGGLLIYEKYIGKNRVSILKEEIIHLCKCGKCQRQVEIIKKPQDIFFGGLSKKELKEDFMNTMIKISKDKQLRNNLQIKTSYINKIKTTLLFKFFDEFTKKEMNLLMNLNQFVEKTNRDERRK